MSVVVPLRFKEEKFDPVNGVSTIKTNIDSYNVEDSVGFIVPTAENIDRVVLNPLYLGEELYVKMKALKLPAKKFKVDDVIANLVIM